MKYTLQTRKNQAKAREYFKNKSTSA